MHKKHTTDDLPFDAAAADTTAIPEALWEVGRRPAAASGITCREVQASVKLLQAVAMARRRKRFGEGGALALNRCKLSFRLDSDGNPESMAEYPIRDSNRCVRACGWPVGWSVRLGVLGFGVCVAVALPRPSPSPSLSSWSSSSFSSDIHAPLFTHHMPPFSLTTMAGYSTVEEYMLLANYLVAERLCEV